MSETKVVIGRFIIGLLMVAYVVGSVATLTLKSVGYISTSWWWILIPVFTPIGIVLGFFCLIGYWWVNKP